MAARTPISHALRLPAPIGEIYTKCGMKLRKGMSKRHLIAMHAASATCVPCAAVVAAELQVKRHERGPVPKNLSAYYDWADGPDSGISSRTIVRAITGAHVLERWEPSPPWDDDDFGRCSRVLKRFPELRPQLHKVAEAHPAWRTLVDAWDELEALYETNLGRLRERLEELRRTT